MEVKGIPKTLERHGLRFEDLGLEGCTLFYRRSESDMPLMEMPEGADEKRREKVYAGRQKMLAKAMEKYRFRFEPLCLPDGLIVENGQLVGLRFRRTKIEGSRVITLDETFERRGVYTISSIGSVPKEIPGIPMKGELFAFTDWDIGRLADYPTVFSAGNVVTGKGNIVASRKHAREVSGKVMEAFLGIGENGHAGEEKLADALAADARADASADRRRDRRAAADQRGRARRGARARDQAPAGGGLRRRLRRVGARRVGLLNAMRRFAALAVALCRARALRLLQHRRRHGHGDPRRPRRADRPGQDHQGRDPALVRRALRGHRRRGARAHVRCGRDRRGGPGRAAVRRHARLRDPRGRREDPDDDRVQLGARRREARPARGVLRRARPSCSTTASRASASRSPPPPRPRNRTGAREIP